jgi:hypothetical protein
MSAEPFEEAGSTSGYDQLGQVGAYEKPERFDVRCSDLVCSSVRTVVSTASPVVNLSSQIIVDQEQGCGLLPLETVDRGFFPHGVISHPNLDLVPVGLREVNGSGCSHQAISNRPKETEIGEYERRSVCASRVAENSLVEESPRFLIEILGFEPR